VADEREPRSPLGVGLELASRITTIGLEFALPPVAGFGLDYWLGTTPAATLIGAVIGFVVGMLHAVRLSSDLTGGPQRPGGRGT
jgi:ATP synthase protein I